MRVLHHDPSPTPPSVAPERTPPPGEAEAIARLYGGSRRAPAGRPWVLANMVAGVDGSLAVGGRVGDLSSAVDRRLFVHLRGLSDAVVVGAGTARDEGYGPVRLPPAVREARVASGRPEVPPLVVVSRSMALDPQAAMFTGPQRTIVLTSTDADPGRVDAVASVADVIRVGSGRVDLAAGLGELAERGAEVVLTEGGPTLLAEMVDLDLVDELCLTLAPVLGGDPFTMAVGGADRRLVHLALASVAEAEGELFLRYLRPGSLDADRS